MDENTFRRRAAKAVRRATLKQVISVVGRGLNTYSHRIAMLGCSLSKSTTGKRNISATKIMLK